MHPAAALPLENTSETSPAVATRSNGKRSVRFVEERDHFDSPLDGPSSSSSSSDDDADSFSDVEDANNLFPEYAPGVLRDETSWAGNLPAAQGLVSGTCSIQRDDNMDTSLLLICIQYDPDNEQDSCGVGFACSIKGVPSHKIVCGTFFHAASPTAPTSIANDAQCLSYQ